MNKFTLPFILALILALMIGPAAAAVSVGTIQYDGACTSAHQTVSSGTITLDFVAVKDFNITYIGPTADAVTIDVNTTHFKITRDSVDGISLLYTGSATACTAAISEGTLTITRDANATNTTYTLADYTLTELVAEIAARADFNCTLADGAVASTGANESALLDAIEATNCKTELILEFTPAVEVYSFANASYNTIAEVVAKLQTIDDLDIDLWWHASSLAVASADGGFVAATGQSIATLYTVTTTYSPTFTVGTYKTFGELKTVLELIPGITVTPSTAWPVNQKFNILGTATLDNDAKDDIEGLAVTWTAGGTIDDSHSPYYKISGTLDDCLFMLQLYEPSKWFVAYESSGTVYIIGGP